MADARRLIEEPLATFIRADEALYSRLPVISTADKDRELVYRGAFSLVRQMMLPPAGKCSYNYYVFSREPTWGWGHEGQVFHESLSMLTYVYMDPQGAMDSQRIFIERQQQDGFIGNGPVWLLWNYFVFRGLIDYGYKDLASDVVSKVMEAVTYQLRKSHHFWESYSPDYSTLESPPSYIWDCIIAQMMIDLQEK